MNNPNLYGIIMSIVLVAIVAISAIVGAKRGFIKSIKGVVSSILAVVLAVVCSSALCGFVAKSTSIDDKIDSAIQGAVADKLPNSDVIVRFSDHDADPNTDPILVYETEAGPASFDTIFDGSVFGVVGIADIIQNAISQDLMTEEGDFDLNAQVVFIDAVSGSITDMVVLIITFIVSIIVFKLVISLLLHALSNNLEKVKVLNFIDIGLGSILGAIIGAIIMLVLVTIIQLIGDFNVVSGLNEIAEQSAVFQLIADKNIIYNYFAKLLAK